MKIFEYHFWHEFIIGHEYCCTNVETVDNQEFFFETPNSSDNYLLGEYLNNVSKKVHFSFLRKLNKHQEKKIEIFLKNENL